MKQKDRTLARDQAIPEFFSKAVADARRFYLDLNPPKEQKLAVVCGGIEHCTASYAVQRATFPFYSIEYVVRGRGQVRLKDRSLPLQPGAIFTYGPGVSHHISGDPANPLVKYFVDFTGTEALKLLRSCRLPPGRAGRVFPPMALQPLFDELIQSGLRARRESAELCVRLLECMALRIASAPAPVGGAETPAFAKYQECRRLIEQDFRRLKTLEQIAAECHITSAYLCRLFRRYDNQSPYQCLLRLKMGLAAERLQQTDAVIKQVAEESGFSDPFHFSRVFKQVLGLSPAALRGLR